MSLFHYSEFEIIQKLCNAFNSYSNAISQVIFSPRMAFLSTHSHSSLTDSHCALSTNSISSPGHLNVWNVENGLGLTLYTRQSQDSLIWGVWKAKSCSLSECKVASRSCSYSNDPLVNVLLILAHQHGLYCPPTKLTNWLNKKIKNYIKHKLDTSNRGTTVLFRIQHWAQVH